MNGHDYLAYGKRERPESQIVILVTVFTQVLLLLLAAAGGWWRRIAWWHALAIPGAGVAVIVYGLLGGLGAAVMASGATRLWPGLRAALNQVVIPFFQHLPFGTAIAVVTCSAIGEEIFFRGFLQPVVGLVWQALLFGVLHWGFRRELVAYGVMAGIAGLWLGYLYSATGVLWTVFVAHAVYNVADLWAIRRGWVGSQSTPGLGRESFKG